MILNGFGADDPDAPLPLGYGQPKKQATKASKPRKLVFDEIVIEGKVDKPKPAPAGSGKGLPWWAWALIGGGVLVAGGAALKGGRG